MFRSSKFSGKNMTRQFDVSFKMVPLCVYQAGDRMLFYSSINQSMQALLFGPFKIGMLIFPIIDLCHNFHIHCSDFLIILNIWVRNYLFFRNYVTSEGAVSHNDLYLSTALRCSFTSFHANTLSHYQTRHWLDFTKI